MQFLTLLLQCLSTQSRKVPAMQSWPWWWFKEVQRRREAGGEADDIQTGEDQNRRWEFSMWNNAILNSIFWYKYMKSESYCCTCSRFVSDFEFSFFRRRFWSKKSGCISVNTFFYPVANADLDTKWIKYNSKTIRPCFWTSSSKSFLHKGGVQIIKMEF